MNLTSKRMLQFMTVCAGVCALSASATTTTWVTDSFEAPEGTNGNPIAWYKMTVSGTYNENTNFLWTSAEGDASKIISGYATNYAGIHPIDGADQNLFLNLETEGQTLSRTVPGGQPFDASSVFVDTLIKFTPSEDNPEIADSNIKVAVFVNVNSNLVVYHRWATEDWSSVLPTNSVFPGIIDPATWHRLTIEMKYQGGIAYPASRIFLDGVALTNALSYSAAGTRGAGEWFINANPDDNTTLSSVAFQGTGAVDELVVADAVDFGGSAAILLTLSYDSGIQSVLTNGVSLSSGTAVVSGTPVTVNAKDWYQIASVTGATYPEYAGDLSASNQITSAVLTLSALASTNVTIASEVYTGGSVPSGIGAGYGDVTKLAAWALANNKSIQNVADNSASWLDDYLFNVAPDSNAKLVIASIAVGETNAQIVITTDKPGIVTNLSGINGVLKYYTTDALGTAFAPKGTVTVTGAGTSVTVNVPLTDGKFIKAVLE